MSDERITLNDCASGDLVAIVWPHGSDCSVGPFGDVALRDSEVLVMYCRGSGKAPSKKEHQPNAIVVVCDRETHEECRDGLRIVSNVEVLDVVERRHMKVDDVERGTPGDVNDPMLNARR